MMHYASEASVIRPGILAEVIEEFGHGYVTERLTDAIVAAVLKAQREHRREVIGEE